MEISTFKRLACMGLLALSLAACGRAAPDAGEAGVLIAKPWFFGHGGVEDEAVTTGMSFTSFTTSTVYVSIVPQSFEIKYDDIMSRDGIPLSFQATVTLQVTDPVSLVKNFSGGADDINDQPAWYVNNVEPVVNNLVRDAFKGQDMHALAIETTGTNAVEIAVKKRLAEYIGARRLPVEVINFTLGRVNPPQDIKSQRIKTAEEQQRQETERQTKIAEDNRKQAETARAEADNAYRQNLGLSPEQFVELQRIDMMRQACGSKVKCTFVVGNAQALVNSK